MNLEQVAGDVWACLQPDRGLGWSNSALVATGGGLVIDTFWDLPRTKALQECYRSVLGGPPEIVVNTNHNGDHCWGNQLFSAAGAEIFAHEECASRMGEDVTPEALVSLSSADPDELPPAWRWLVGALAAFDFRKIEPTRPDHTVSDTTSLEVGDLEVRLIPVGPAHTAGDLIVHIPDRSVVCAGDILFNRCTPIGWEGTTENWCDALRLIEDLRPDIVVPGHGPLATPADVRAARRYLEWLTELAFAGFERGMTPVEVATTSEIPEEYLTWTEPERILLMLHRLLREYEGGDPMTSPSIMGALDELLVVRRHLEARAPTRR